MTLAVRGLLLWALLLGGASARRQGSDSRAPSQAAPTQSTRPAQPTQVVLTNEHAEGSFPIAPEILASPPPVLALSIPLVINPEKTPFQVFVYLSYQPGLGAKHRVEPVKILLGNVGLYPPDRPGGFLLRASTAFAKLNTASPQPAEVRLLLQMKRIHPTKPWTQVEVTVAPPKWEAEPRP